MATILRGSDNVDSANIATDIELSLKANTTDLKEIGVGQTWQNVTASRSLGVTYTNTSGNPIMVTVNAYRGAVGICRINAYVNGNDIQIDWIENTSANTQYVNVTFIVPPGDTYRVDNVSGAALQNWNELR